MPLGFWGDESGERYRAAYFERFPGVWAHGDFASWTTHGGMIIHGRSDTTLNPGGIRIGTAEIYRQVEQIPEVVESLVFGQEWEGDTRIVLLVRLAETTQPEKLCFRFVLTLILMRKRLVIYENTRHDEAGREIWTVRLKGREERLDVIDPKPTDEQIASVREQLGQILNEDA